MAALTLLASLIAPIQSSDAQMFNDEVKIKIRIFIPSPIVDWPGLDPFGGDGRGFSENGGTSRLDITFRLDVNTNEIVPGSTISSWGETTRYNESDTSHVSGRPSWWDRANPGSTPVERSTLQVTDDNVSITQANGGVVVNINGVNPLAPNAPAINATFAISTIRVGSSVTTQLMGRHDGFPSYEAYSDGQMIHGHRSDVGPWSPADLLPPTNVPVNKAVHRQARDDNQDNRDSDGRGGGGDGDGWGDRWGGGSGDWQGDDSSDDGWGDDGNDSGGDDSGHGGDSGGDHSGDDGGGDSGDSSGSGGGTYLCGIDIGAQIDPVSLLAAFLECLDTNGEDPPV